MDATKPVHVLCLDGGGVRGLSSLLILRSLMQQLQISAQAAVAPLPCEVFDLICGTSTGGLIALMLGRLRMNVDEAIDCYIDFSEQIFGKKASFALFRRLSGSAMYDASTLEECVKRIVSKHGRKSNEGNETLQDPLDGKDGPCRTFVVAVTRSYADSPPRRFRSYTTKTRLADKCKIWEAARATTAASTFFDPISIGSPPQTFIDGALSGANNPSQLALDEMSQVFPDRPIGCFLSLGTGVSKIVPVRGGLAKIAAACVKLLTSCEIVANEVTRDFNKKTPEGQINPYFRFSVNRGLDEITLDEWRRVEELTATTLRYMEIEEQKILAKRCVEALRARVDEVQARTIEVASS